MAEGSPKDQLCTASANGDLPKVKHLVENGTQVNGRNKYGRTPLQVAKLGATDLVEFLLESGADSNLRDPVLALTVAHDASREGFLDTLTVLMSHGADVNLVDWCGNLPLHLGAQEGHIEVFQLLLAHTADPGLQNGQGLTALDVARGAGHMTIVKWMEARAL